MTSSCSCMSIKNERVLLNMENENFERNEKSRFHTDERIIGMKMKDLNDLVFYATRRAMKQSLDNHFRGLEGFLTVQHDLQEETLKEIKAIKARLDKNE